MLAQRFMTKARLTFVLTVCLLQDVRYVNADITPITLEIVNGNVEAGSYRLQPNEILPIEPLLIYPKTHELEYRGRNLDNENRIIYVKLLQHKQNSRPVSNTLNEDVDAGYVANAHAYLNEIGAGKADDDADVANNIIAKPLPYTHNAYKYKTKQFSLKDVYYVKSLVNGRFSHDKIKVYRLPEFYAINVFRNAPQIN